MNKIFIATLLIAISCRHDKPAEVEIIKPSWEIGDYRYYKVTGSIFARVKADTIMSTNFEKVLKLTVLEKKLESYVLQVERVSTSDLKMSTSIDSLKYLTDNINKTMDLLKTLLKYFKPFKISVTNNGEILDIIKYDQYYDQLISDLTKAKDSVKIDELEKETLMKMAPRNEDIKEKLRLDLIKEVYDLFELYNVKNSINEDLVISEQVPNPRTGELINTTSTYHTVSVKNDIQEIERSISIDPSIQQLLKKDSLATGNKKSLELFDMKSLTKYRFNTRTTWPVHVDQKVYFKNDEFEYKIDFISETYE